MKRIFEIILGIVLVLLVQGGYGDGVHPVKHLVDYVTSNAVLQIILTIAVLILAAKLIAGKPKDYSRFFYNLLVKFFGLPGKRRNVNS